MTEIPPQDAEVVVVTAAVQEHRALVTRLTYSVAFKANQFVGKLDEGSRFLVRAWCDPDNRLPAVIASKKSWVLGLQFALVALIMYGVFDMLYVVDVGQEGVHLRLGRFSHVTQPGLNVQLPFGIDEVVFVNTQFIIQDEFGYRTKIEQGPVELTSVAQLPPPSQGDGAVVELAAEHTELVNEAVVLPLVGHPEFLAEESQMLTGNLNIIFISWAFQYEIVDSYKYLFRSAEVPKNMRDIGLVAMSKAVGNRVDIEVLTHNREALAQDAKRYAQAIVDQLDVGIQVREVLIQDVSPPPSTQPSYHEVNSASQDVEHLINQAEREYNRTILKAYGEADEIISNGRAYASLVVNRAKGESSRFASIVAEYKKAPEVTKSRIFLETMEDVFAKTPFTLVDQDINGVMPLLSSRQNNRDLRPLQEAVMAQANFTAGTTAPPMSSTTPVTPAQSASAPLDVASIAPVSSSAASGHPLTTAPSTLVNTAAQQSQTQAQQSAWSFFGWW